MTALVVLLIVVSVVGVTLVSQHEARDRTDSLFELNGTAYAGIVGSYLTQELGREQHLASRALGGQHLSHSAVESVEVAVGAEQLGITDDMGHPLDVAPQATTLAGAVAAAAHQAGQTRKPLLTDARVATAPGTSVVIAAVPFPTAYGERVAVSTYQMGANATLAYVASVVSTYVDNVVAYKRHEVVVVDASGTAVVSSRHHLGAMPWRGLAPSVAAKVAGNPTRAEFGTVDSEVFVVAPIPGTSWYLTVAVPSAGLYTASSLPSRTFWFVVAVVVALGAVTVLLQRRQILANRALRELAETMRTSALTDPLTGLANRRHLLEHLERVSAESERSGRPYAVLMIDLDRFKVINDGQGHAAGDAVLRSMADCLRQAARPGDLYGRWGGDELMVVVPAAEGRGPERTAERVLAFVRASRPAVDGTEVCFSVSIGYARGTEPAFDDLIRRADMALYRAKASGGGMVVEAGPATGEPSYVAVPGGVMSDGDGRPTAHQAACGPAEDAASTAST